MKGHNLAKIKASARQLQELRELAANHNARMREAWQRAADKHGEEYANEIFPSVKESCHE